MPCWSIYLSFVGRNFNDDMSSAFVTYDYTTFSMSGGRAFDRLEVEVEGVLTNLNFLSEQLGGVYSNEEIVAAAYTKWGEHFIDQIEGTFFIVIFDQEKRELLLYRDKMGVVPCYYFKTDHFFACSTSIQSLLQLDEVDRVLNVSALGSYISYGHVHSSETLIKGVSQLLPAHYLILNDEEFTITPYWSITSHYDYISEGRTREQHTFHLDQLQEDFNSGNSPTLLEQSETTGGNSFMKWIAEVDHPSIHALDYFEIFEQADLKTKNLAVMIGENEVWGKGKLYDSLEGLQSKKWLLSYPKNLRNFLSRWVNIPHKQSLGETYSQLIFQDYFDLDYLYPTYRRLYPIASLQKSLEVEFVDEVQGWARKTVVYQTEGFQFPYLSKLGLMELQTRGLNAQLPALYDAQRAFHQRVQLPYLEWKRLRYLLNLPDQHKTVLRKWYDSGSKNVVGLEMNWDKTEDGVQKLHQFAHRKVIKDPLRKDIINGFPRLTKEKRNQLNHSIIILEAWLQQNKIND